MPPKRAGDHPLFSPVTRFGWSPPTMTAPAALAIGLAAATLGAAALVAGPSPADEAPITGSVTVIEGDVLEIAGTRIRLFEIDAPELD